MRWEIVYHVRIYMGVEELFDYLIASVRPNCVWKPQMHLYLGRAINECTKESSFLLVPAPVGDVVDDLN